MFGPVMRQTVDGPPFDAVVARGFGPPVHTLTIALGWVRADGLVVISEPPERRSVGGPRRSADAIRLPSAPTVSVFRRGLVPPCVLSAVLFHVKHPQPGR